MFYNKEIGIVKETDGYVNDSGRWVDGEMKVVKTIECDVQPFSQELANREYGYNEVIQYRIFCDPDDKIELGGTIRYQNKDYIIKNIVDWDDYWILLIRM